MPKKFVVMCRSLKYFDPIWSVFESSQFCLFDDTEYIQEERRDVLAAIKLSLGYKKVVWPILQRGSVDQS